MKKITALKINELVANQKANAVAKVLQKKDPTAVVERNVYLREVVCRQPAFDHAAGVPFYAFAKNVGKNVILVDVMSGKAKAFTSSSLASITRVKRHFKIGGTVYAVKDTINGHRRYRVVRSGASKPRKKMRVYDIE